MISTSTFFATATHILPESPSISGEVMSTLISPSSEVSRIMAD
jgi:hypothetical protein